MDDNELSLELDKEEMTPNSTPTRRFSTRLQPISRPSPRRIADIPQGGSLFVESHAQQILYAFNFFILLDYHASLITTVLYYRSLSHILLLKPKQHCLSMHKDIMQSKRWSLMPKF
ncbi:hypothetical protein BC936DRAFT_150024 [Jimgerdemannia flammicorona]|uniref:Uncharacterized protein n=1 Tax=Jimgerdemannia flammicorona TaxID=994334 RepID=A0A433CZM3_9FUNG|nr:hypothetical protein BC936DRAFT_150024 [Jimgerdemannia flammicorona]